MAAKIPQSNLTIRKAKARWDDVRKAAQAGDPQEMLTAVSRFEGIAGMMFLLWTEEAESRASEP